MTKTITRQQIAGSEGEAFVRQRSNAIGFLYTPYNPPEAGIDGFLEIRDPVTGAMSGRFVAVQVKTTDNGTYTAESDHGFEYLMDGNDVDYWHGSNIPVVVVLVHLGRSEAYWKSVDTGEGSGARRLRIDKTKDRFDASARDTIADLCVAKGGWGVWFPPLKCGEAGHLNLLEVILPRMFMSPLRRSRPEGRRLPSCWRARRALPTIG